MAHITDPRVVLGAFHSLRGHWTRLEFGVYDLGTLNPKP